jgi:ankyrin repeat protein
MMNRFLSQVLLISAALAGSQPAYAQAPDYGRQLIEAVRKGDGGQAMALLTANPTLVNTRNSDGDTPLLTAIALGKEDWASFFIGKGADVNSANKKGETPLIIATRNRSEQVVGLILGRNAKIDQSNKVGETPLIVAVQLRDANLAKTLLDAGADPDKADYSGHSARDYARSDDRNQRIHSLFDRLAPKKTN